MKLEDLVLDVWALITNEYLHVSLKDVVALSQTSRCCRLGAHTLRYAVGLLASRECLDAHLEGAWPRLRNIFFVIDEGSQHSEWLRLAAMLHNRSIGLSLTPPALQVVLREGISIAALDMESLVPNAVGELDESLKTLQLRRLVAIPESVGNLRALTMLRLSKCHDLHSLPGTVFQLTGLLVLEVSCCNNLKTLPDVPWRLRSLET